MAVGDHLPVLTPQSASSTSMAPSSMPVIRSRRFVQVATNNSPAFIQFPMNSRQSPVFVPTYRSRTSLSVTRTCSRTTDSHSISHKSKSSKTRSSNEASTGRQRNISQQGCNPILTNSLLNHRKEQPIFHPGKISIDFTQITKLSLPSKPVPDDDQIPPIRDSTAPLVADQTKNTDSDEQILPNDNEDNIQEEVPRLNKSKYDYITRWLHEVERATYSKVTFAKIKHSTNRTIQS